MEEKLPIFEELVFLISHADLLKSHSSQQLPDL